MAKKISLREFQEHLASRLAGAARGEAEPALLGVQAGGENWLLELFDSGEIVPLPPITGVPLTRPWYVGLANIRGTLFSVSDFSAFLGCDPTPHNANARLVLVGARHGSNAALLAARLLGLKRREGLTPLPPLESGPEWARERVEDSEGRRWRKLSVKGLLADPDFMHIGA
ncbi:twitching motility protein [Oryzomicrobium terrae]|uniref:Twitching motility protein n=1 Tax=Oryzomicrobium terrae TaxID=1735038 RepID=A0A5C1EE84_9RHOO|nr:chemotaxis protein CheW [Oryzomicrobium terrae]QEL66457.1 twitching motility protein [Oryzomicrobium terrae]